MANLQVGVAGNGTVTVGAGASVHSPASNALTLGTNNSEWIRIDSGGRFLVGNTASQEVYGTNKLQIQGTSATTSGMSLLRHGGSPYLALGATGGSSLNAVTAVADDSRLGQLTFVGADGTDVNTHAASVAAYVDGSVSSNAVPGRLVFKTSTGASEVERLRITSAGRVGIAENDPDTTLHVKVTSTEGIRLERNGGAISELVNDTDLSTLGTTNNFNLAFKTNNTERARVLTDGGFKINDGDLVIGTAGHGIDFSAQTQSGSTTDDEILDHYEKGKWTPDVRKNNVSNATADIIHGRYIRIGKLCWLSMYARWNSGSNAQGTSGGWTIHGLPFSLQDDNPGTCRIYQSAPAGYMSIDGTNYAYGDNPRWQINTSTYFDLYTDTSSADQAWTTGQMIVHFTGTFMIHE